MHLITYKGYTGVFAYDPEADIFHGDLILDHDFVTFQGRLIEEMPGAMADSVEDYIELCTERGKTPSGSGLSYKGYEAEIYFSPEDECLVGRIAGIDDIVSFHGYSAYEIKDAFKGSVDFYLETCGKDGHEPNRPRQC